MSATDSSDLEREASGGPPKKAGPSRRSSKRRWLLLGVAIIGLLSVAGVFIAVNLGPRKPPIQAHELPDIPTVNLEGADPAIARVVNVARGILEQFSNEAESWGQYAMVLHAHGFADAAHICYDVAIRLDPKNPKWPYLQGDLYYDGPGGPDAATPFFEAAARLSPPESLAQVRVSDSLLELGRLDEAERGYRKILAINRDDPQALLGLGKLAIARRQYQESLQYLLPLAEQSPVQNTACTLLANVYDRLGDRANADQIRQHLAEVPPDQTRRDDPILQVVQLEVGVRVELARAEKLMEQQQVKELLASVEDTVHRYPDSFEAWAALANAYGVAGDPTGAERAAKKGTQLAPKNPEAWLSLGNILIWQRRYKDALEPLQKSIQLNPKNRQAYVSLSECHKGLGDSESAAAALKLAGLEQDPQPASPAAENGEELPSAVKEYFPFMSFYYTNPQPEKVKQMLEDIIKPKNLDNPWYKNRESVLQLMAAILGDVGYGQEGLVRFYESKFAETSDAGKRIIIRALQTCGDQSTEQVVDTWLSEATNDGVKKELIALKEHLVSPDRKRHRDRVVQDPHDLDYLWGDFFATGEFAPIARILDVFDLPDDSANAKLKEIARFSAISNFQLHPQLVNLVEKHLAQRPKGSRAAIVEMFKGLPRSESEKQ